MSLGVCSDICPFPVCFHEFFVPLKSSRTVRFVFTILPISSHQSALSDRISFHQISVICVPPVGLHEFTMYFLSFFGPFSAKRLILISSYSTMSMPAVEFPREWICTLVSKCIPGLMTKRNFHM
uniref:Uncharacterized protein n=1 Tax=Cacopsylla melanoneura TaxID=428564 RepID=A0A8D8VTW7_9HEMI